MSTIKHLIWSSLLCSCGILMTVSGYASTAESGSNARRLPATPANFWELTGPLAVQPMPFDVISDDPAAVQMRFYDPQVQYTPIDLNGQQFTTVRMPSEGSTVVQGEPDLPRVTKLIMISPTGDVQLNVTSSSYTTVTNIDAAPKQPYEGEDLAENALDDMGFAYDASIYGQDAWYPEEIAVITAPATLRDVRFVSVAVTPVQYNPVRRELRVLDNIEVEIVNTGGVGENEIVGETAPYISPSFKKLYRQFENFAGSALDELPVLPGKYLIICVSGNTAVATEAQRLVAWHRRKGLDASYVTTATSGATATAMRDYISSQYVTSGKTLEYVCLVGDPDYAVGVPSGSSLQGYDNFFGVVSPSNGPNPDPVPDIAVGRLPANSEEALTEIVTKSINYESNPYTGDMGWFTRAHCAAHTGVSSRILQQKSTRVRSCFRMACRSDLCRCFRRVSAIHKWTRLLTT
ncbi:MAG: hypothetical protein IPG71_12725 [bacterium]|nr:hypothetical protein [bacterium]